MRIKPKHKRKADARYHIIAQSLFKDFGYDGNLEAFLIRLQKYKGVVKRQAEFSNRREKWNSTPMYGYASIESINNNLSYIADRFNCAGRLYWLLGLDGKLPK